MVNVIRWYWSARASRYATHQWVPTAPTWRRHRIEPVDLDRLLIVMREGEPTLIVT